MISIGTTLSIARKARKGEKEHIIRGTKYQLVYNGGWAFKWRLSAIEDNGVPSFIGVSRSIKEVHEMLVEDLASSASTRVYDIGVVRRNSND